MGHIIEILDGVETPVPHDDESNRTAELEAEYPDHIVKTYIVCETPERMAELEKAVEKFCKKT